MSSVQTPLSDPRVVVTTHDAEGKSIFDSDQILAPYMPFGPGTTSFVTFDTQTRIPVSNQPSSPTSSSPTAKPAIPRCPPSGITFGTTQFPPLRSAPMHRTLSLDYAVVLSGEIVLELDSGEEKTVRAGEFIVQRGVNHAWHNRSETEACRIVFIMVGAEGVKLEGGEVLEETVILK